MRKSTRWVLGFDIGDKRSATVLLDRETGETTGPKWLATTGSAVETLFRGLPADTRVILEAGTHSGWIADLGRRLGVDILVADPRQLDAVTKNLRKSDEHDAAMLAELGASSLRLLHETYVRDRAMQAKLSVIRARDALVRSRTVLVNAARGIVKAHGARVPKCSSSAFPDRAAESVPKELEAIVAPMAEAICALTATIRAYDEQIRAMCKDLPEARRLCEVDGVGPLTALTFVLTIGDPARFRRTRDVAAYLGLVPRRAQSGAGDPQLRISKAGDALMRRLLVQCAHRILGPFGKDCDLRAHGLELAARGGKAGKKRAVVAVARKLAVMLLSIWKSGAAYEPHRGAKAA